MGTVGHSGGEASSNARYCVFYPNSEQIKEQFNWFKNKNKTTKMKNIFRLQKSKADKHKYAVVKNINSSKT